jgi:hypothetical protein
MKAAPLRPVPVEVRGSSGRWHGGFVVVAFNADGTATIRSKATGVVRHLQPHEWRDPVEEHLLQAFEDPPAAPA